MGKDLETRVRILEDIEEIRQLKSRYVYALDERDWDSVVDSFTDDAKVDFGTFGGHQGRKEIEEFFKVTFPPGWSFTMHMTQDPIIEVDGDKAKGKWYMHESTTFAETDTAVWGAAKYEDEFVRVDGKWKCSYSLVKIIFLTPYDEGWAKKKMII
jgi:ketosteroid isomerase-like protein